MAHGGSHLSRQARRVRRRGAVAAHLAGAFARSTPTAVRNRDDFASVERFVLFVGHRRSGHSLVGSLLNAHPDVVVSHQLNALLYVLARFRRNQLYALILEADRRFGAQQRMSDTGAYDYAVPGQWQGRYRQLRVIGDKRGGTSRALLDVRPDVLDRTRALVGVPLRIVHVMRNPFDNIATMSRRNRTPLSDTITTYFANADATERLRGATWPGEWTDLRHEDLIADANAPVRHLCRFLGVDAPEDYVAACASIVYDRPHRSWYEVEWNDGEIERVEAEMARYPLLSSYTFAEPDKGVV